MSFFAWLSDEGNISMLQWLQGVVTIVAIAVGGAWAYLLFVRRRQKYPRANLTQDLRCYPLRDNKLLLRATVRICNESEVLLSLASGLSRVQQVLPCTEDLVASLAKRIHDDDACEPEVEWPLLEEWKVAFKKGEREIEPGESDELHFDFVVDSDVQVVVLYSYLKNVRKRKREIGWNVTSIYDLRSRS